MCTRGESCPRHAEPALARLLETFPVVVVTGARQTGKSTLVRERLPGERTHLTLDAVLERRLRGPTP